LITDRWETTRGASPAGSANPPPAIAAVRIIVLVVMLATVPLASPHPGLTGPRGIAITVALAVTAVAWIVWLRAGGRGRAGSCPDGRWA